MTTTWNPVNKAAGTSWTDVAKPAFPTVSNGTPIGFLLALTFGTTSTLSYWNGVTKASNPTSWNNVPKAT